MTEIRRRQPSIAAVLSPLSIRFSRSPSLPPSLPRQWDIQVAAGAHCLPPSRAERRFEKQGCEGGPGGVQGARAPARPDSPDDGAPRWQKSVRRLPGPSLFGRTSLGPPSLPGQAAPWALPLRALPGPNETLPLGPNRVRRPSPLFGAGTRAGCRPARTAAAAAPSPHRQSPVRSGAPPAHHDQRRCSAIPLCRYRDGRLFAHRHCDQREGG